MSSPASVLFSLQSKLIIAFVSVTLVAMLLAASIFVFVRRGDLEDQKLDHVIATSPIVYAQFSVLQERATRPELLGDFVDVAAEVLDVRILMVERSGGAVAADSAGELTGQSLAMPADFTLTVRSGVPAHHRYMRWEPERGTPGSDLILVSAAQGGEFRGFAPPRQGAYVLLLAVPKATIADAWQGVLGGLAVAAAIALAVAIVLAVIVARYITRPLQQLTVASQRMAAGSYDIEISVDRRDEVGRLAQAFSTMAGRVGEAHSQMHALVANVSHDLKTPLTSILGFAQALRDGGAEDEPDAQHMGGVIYDEASRLAARLNDLLLLSELESGQALLQRDEIDLGRLTEESVRRLEPAANARGVQVATELAEGVVVSADGQKLERALENLLDNAAKYATSGGEIRVRLRVDEMLREARIDVANTAEGISAEELPRLFERFYRRDRQRDAKGSGLGLPIARDLIELHGGTLTASVADGDLVFTIRLPLVP